MRAPVNIFGVPEAHQGVYHIRDWRRTPLFSCVLEMDDTMAVGPELPIRLVKNQALVAQSLYRPGSVGTVVSVGGSSKHYVLMIQNGSLRALVGIAFIDRSDAIDFSFLLHEFSRRYIDPPKMVTKKRQPLELALAATSDGPKAGPKADSSSSSDSGSDSEGFGEFQ